MLNNLHNFIISASLSATDDGNQKASTKGDYKTGFNINKQFSPIETTPHIPWSKVKAFKHDGFMTTKQSQSQFLRDKIMVSRYFLNVKITIPGNQCIRIYDKLVLFNIKYYVTQISHSIDLTSKKWTTDLTLCNVIDDTNVTN